MLQVGCRLDLREETLGSYHCSEFRLQDFERDFPLVPEIVGQVHRGHPALAEPASRDPHGGALKRGGNWGNRGGRQETPKVRDRLIGFRDDTLEDLKEKLKAGDLSDSDIIKLATLAAKYTLPAVAYNQDLIDELWDATEGVLLKVDDPAMIQKVKKAWMPVLASRLM